VGFWSALLDQLWSSRTPFVVVAYILTRALVGNDQRIARYHMRAATTFLFGHVVALAITAGQIATGYDAEIAEIAKLAFALLLVVTLGTTALFRALLPRIGLALPQIMIDIINAIGVLIVFIVVGQRAGFSVAGLITTSAVLTAVIGFSLQDTLGNVMGGLSLQLDKSVAVGDWITGPNLPASGRVTEIRWRYTAIETRAWETIIIPNGLLVKSPITISGRRSQGATLTRRQVDFFVDFRTAPTRVIDAVQGALRADPVPNTSGQPPPIVLFIGVRDSFAQYCVRYWLVDLAVDDPTDSAVRVRVWFALQREGIAMSIPANAIFLTHETPDREARKADQELQRRLTALASVDLFRGLSEATRRDLADHLAYTPFAAGESVTREGDTDDGLYMLVDGEAIVRIGSGREEREVARIAAGQFFGEMSLMTGEARTATVVAATDLVCYRIDKPAFQHVLSDTPAIAESIAEVLAMRRTALSAVRDERDEQRRKRIHTAKQDLLGKIRGFFGIDHAN
jgi:small-conductance mechanosensitive channel/CRP-like cAMP-binding protein